MPNAMSTTRFPCKYNKSGFKKKKELNYVEIIKLETAKVLVIENSQELCKKENQFDTEMNELIYK